MDRSALSREIATPTLTGQRSPWVWRPLASLTPAQVAAILRRAAQGDARDFLLAADDVREKDLHYRSVLQTRALSAAGLPAMIAPADDSEAARRAASLCDGALARLDLSELLAALMDAVAKGFAVAEIVWETTGGRWLPAAVEPKPQHWFRFDAATGAELRLEDGSAEGAALPPHKIVLHAPPVAAGLKLLGGVARSALWAWVFKSYAMRDWARFAELYGQPFRLGRYHAGATPEDVAVLKKAVFELGSDAAAVVPEGMALELIEVGGKAASAELYQGLIEYLDRQVSKAVLGQTLTTDQGTTGSLAQARVHQEVRADLTATDARALAETLRRDLLTPIVRLNLADAPVPTITLAAEGTDDLGVLAEQVERLARAGVTIPVAWVRERFGIPEPVEGEATIGGAAADPLGWLAGSRRPVAAGSVPAFHATRAQAVAPTEAVAAMAERMEAEAAPAWDAILDHLRALVAASPDLHSLRAAILGAFADLPRGRLAEVLAMGMAAAELAGRFDAVDDADSGS